MLKKLALGCAVAAILAAIGIYAAWRQITRLPEWYSESAAELGAGGRPPSPGSDRRSPATSAPEDPDPAGRTSEGRTPEGRTPKDRSEPRPQRRGLPLTAAEIRRSSGRVELDERQLNELLLGALEDHRNGRRVKRAAKAVRASIHGDRLEVGVVTNLADLAAVAENGREAEVIRRLERFAPWLQGRDFYLAARGKPGVRNGNLFFDRDLELVVGGVGFNAADTAARLGVPQEELDAGAELPIAGLRLEDVEVENGSVVLSLAR